jgi:hypothetical protein
VRPPVCPSIDFGKTRMRIMGGYGSGSGGVRRKITVEECLSFSMTDIRNGCGCTGAGEIHWTSCGRQRSSIAFAMYQDARDGVLSLSYHADGEPIRIRVSLQTTPARFGGWRWWFTCPLAVGGVPCFRRVGKLFLPPGARLFGCRECHQLSYRSSQEAHREERLFAYLGLPMHGYASAVR